MSVYRVEAERIAHAGGKIRRVVLDHELKRESQTFLNRSTRSNDRSFDDERRAFAEGTQLPIVDGHLELPDLRIEYEPARTRVSTRTSRQSTERMLGSSGKEYADSATGIPDWACQPEPLAASDRSAYAA